MSDDSNLNLQKDLNNVFTDGMKDIQVALESAKHIAASVKELRLFEEQHEVHIDNMGRMLLILLSTKATWHGSIEGIGHRLKQGKILQAILFWFRPLPSQSGNTAWA